jgi:LPS-assembly lipoprotein
VPALPAVPRRLALAGAVLGLGLIAGCGFAPRGQVTLPFSRIYLSAPSASAFAAQLRRHLRANGVEPALRRDDAPVRFELLSETNEREITALSTAGRPREYQVRLKIRWQLRDSTDRSLIPPTELVLRRAITVLDALGQLNLEEEALMLRDMRADAAQQIVRQISAVRPA